MAPATRYKALADERGELLREWLANSPRVWYRSVDGIEAVRPVCSECNEMGDPGMSATTIQHKCDCLVGRTWQALGEHDLYN